MKARLLRAARSRPNLALLSTLLATHCLNKPNQYTAEDPSIPTATDSGVRGVADGSAQSRDGLPSSTQGCGTICDLVTSDACCPETCSSITDMDCAAQCGNGVLERGETCDPIAACPTSCPNRGCTAFSLQGSPSACTATCVEVEAVTICKPNDQCCPPGCSTTNDSDCSVVCGNGVKESNETCDPPDSCPTSCPADACQLRKLINPGTCSAECVNDRLQTTCIAGDGCCPPGCNTGNDIDCQIRCGDGMKDVGETCDPLSSCPASCPPMGCQLRELRNAGTCRATCENSRLQTMCASGDGCCPSGCNSNNDGDCQPSCDNSVIERGETCEPAAECARRRGECRSDRDTLRTGRGSESQCNFECIEMPRACGPADAQCPTGCTEDPDCRRANGASCDAASQCLSNRCADNRCCTQMCNGCQTCTGPGGTCSSGREGQACGSDWICRGGSCALDCIQDAPCGDSNEECREFRLDCSSGRRECRPRNREGVPCGDRSSTCTGKTNDKPNTCRGGVCQSNTETCGNCEECRGGACQARQCQSGERCRPERDACESICMPADCGACRDCGSGGCVNGPERNNECGGLGCANGQCITCGQLNLPCCSDGTCRFTPDGRSLACLRSSRESICVDTNSCGNSNQRVCPVVPCKFPLVPNIRNICVDPSSCGKMGQDCCRRDSETGRPECEPPFSCSDDFRCTDS